MLLATSIFSSCMEKDVYQGPKSNKPLNPSEVFDFKLTNEVKLNIDYGFTNDYYIIFEIYDQNPMKEEGDSWVKDESLSSIYSASTDTKGRYSGTITLASDITEVWLYSDYLGTISPVRLSVSNNAINFSQKNYIASVQTKATTTSGYTYPEDWKLLPGADWDQYGLPSNLEAGLNLPPSEILYSIRDTYHQKNKLGDSNYVNDDATSEINVTKDTEISLSFISSSASFNNPVGYFTYPTGSIPTEKTIQKILAFPNASPITKTNKEGVRQGALLCGNEVKLKYWNESKKQFEDKFPAGVTVGFLLMPSGFKNGTIAKPGFGAIRYSYRGMNSDNKQRIIALRDGGSNQIVAIGFEDSTSSDFCDATFYLNISESNAIEPGPELPPTTPPTNEENTVVHKGTLTFEDQWPSEGDYDMNDVVIEYYSTVYRQVVTNKVYKIVDQFTPIYNGGTHTCGFGYQYSIDQDRVSSIEFSNPYGSQVESEQSNPTVILFDDVKSVLKQTFTVTTLLKDVEEKDIVAPYNPFIFANNRGTEIHLVGGKPTNKADMELFNTKDDVSNTSAGIYYIARFDGEVQLMPFGINLPNVLDFNIPAEKVKIYDTYPGFTEWVSSKGTKNKNWYKK